MQESDQHYDVRVSGPSGPDHSLAFPTREQAEWVAAGIRVQTPGACVTVVGCDSEDCDTPAWPPAGARLGRAGVNRRAPASVKTPRIRPRRGLLNASGRSRGSRASCLVDKASLRQYFGAGQERGGRTMLLWRRLVALLWQRIRNYRRRRGGRRR